MKEREGIKYNEPWILQRADPYVYRHTDGEEKEDVWAIRPYVLECEEEDPLTGKWTEKGKTGRPIFCY